ncbi:hypothetical protein [Amycolatopsis aidingensis]|uniref:hypothetical protein n=1 Tax=Amycolatopsis aidingensis TaxID=2842453 RepID=UPI001E3DA336|nr:hypothetical protein [Amycolatopsis aidingensis]
MRAQRFDVIDAHQHYDTGLGLSALGVGPGEAEGRAETEIASRLSTMDEQGVNGAVVLAGNG